MNKTSNYQFTIVVPVYNEEDNIYALEQRLSEFLPHSLYSTCVLFLYDGSTDKISERIVSLCNRNKDFFSIDLA